MNKKILVLAGGIDQIGLLHDLKSRGYYTILVDYYPNPVAKPYADKHIQESALDLATVLRIAKEEQVDNIISACHDQALLTVAYVAENLGFHKQFTFEQARNITNKLYMKEIMIANNIPTAKFVNIHSLDEGLSNLSYPLMVKPADCNSSKGVRKVDNETELKNAFDYALKVSRTHTAIIEEFKNGMEVSVDAFVENGSVHLLMCSEIRKLKHKSLSIIFQSIIPASLSDMQISMIEAIINQIVVSFELDNTPLLVQFLVDDKDINVIEFSARIGGGLKYVNIKEKTGFDILHENVNAILGEPVKFYRKDNPLCMSRTHLYVHPGVFSSISNYEQLIEDGTIVELNTTKGKGFVIEGISASGDRVGNFLVKAENRELLFQKINKAIDTIKVLDTSGKDILYREMYKQ